MITLLNKIFKLEANNTTISKEILGGVITFFSFCYVLFVNPEILANSETSQQALYTGTILCAIASTIIMTIIANKPLAMAPAMGLNSVLAITICQGLGFSYSQSLALSIISAILFLILTLTKLRIKILQILPNYLVKAIGIGIGLFICMVGLVNSHLLVASPSTLVTLGNFNDPATLTVLCSLIIIIVLTVLKVKGSIIITLVATLAISLLLKVIYQEPLGYTGIFSLPTAPYVTGFITGFSSLGSADIANLIIAIFTLTFLAIFNSLGSIILTKDSLNLTEDKILNRVMLADSLAFFTSGFLGTSPSCILAETMTGVKEGARTGFANIITILLLILALFLSPLLSLIGMEVTSSILIMIGVSMLADLKFIDFSNVKEAIPAFFAILFMPLTYSIINGICFSVISLTIISLVTYDKTKKFKENIHPLLLLLSLIFIIYYILLLI